MNEKNYVRLEPVVTPPPAALLGQGSSFRPLFIAAAILIACFALPVYRLAHFALNSSLYSYILLVPFVSLYLLRITAVSRVPSSGRNRAVAALLIALGAAVLGTYWVATLSGAKLVEQDALALTTLSLVILLSGASAFVLNRPTFRQALFPLAFLLFLVPLPIAIEHAIETFLQRGSAPPALWLFQLAGTPVFREDLVFQLPGMTLQIAPECSGIRSSVVLFITSLVAGHLFLQSPWKRAVLTLAVIPLALLRNGFRVFVIGELCVHVGPHMIDSPIHHHGGPIFFALSLVPFSILTLCLVKSDRTSRQSKQQPKAS
jgi:exosortase C (VPDSG-CTERM-specific)